MTIVQLSVDENQRGRVMGTWYMFAQIAGGIGAYGIGQGSTRSELFPSQSLARHPFGESNFVIGHPGAIAQFRWSGVTTEKRCAM